VAGVVIDDVVTRRRGPRDAMEPLGPKIRRMRRRAGFTLDELAVKTAISKPYLSLIETGRVPNPPSDEKLRRLEQALGFPPGELVTQAHLHRTPRDVRAVLQRLIEEGRKRTEANGNAASGESSEVGGQRSGKGEKNGNGSALGTQQSALGSAINLDDAYLSGVLQELVGQSAGNVEAVRTGAVPVINKVSAGYPRDFTDMGFPPRVADAYIGCPDLYDPDAFAARVHGDSMVPKYREGDIVVFSPAANWREGNDCFVRFDDGQTTFKRVFTEKNDAGVPVLRLQPRNERYRPQIVPTDKISGLYKAVYQYRRVDDD
jgi:phage repressor protein C with HTH and peptisase S24 domain/DNA-binding XRE family transcriptional regulator